MLHPTTRGVTKSLPCTVPVKFEGALWWGMGTLAIIIILLTGLLAGLTLGVMSIDSTRLRVWSNTGAPERRTQAQTILSIRRHPDWLLNSLILASVALAEGLSLIMNHLFDAGDWKPFIFSTLLVAIVGELLPQAIMPMFILPLVHRCSWLKAATPQMEGILKVDELGEFLRMHEVDQGWGGALDVRMGSLLRRILHARNEMVERGCNWDYVLKVDSDCIVAKHTWKETRREDSSNIDRNLLYDMISQTRYDFAVVMKRVDGESIGRPWGTQEMPGEVLGILPKKVLLSDDCFSNYERVLVKDLGILPVAIVYETCRLLYLADWLLGAQDHVAIVVPQIANEPFNTVDGIALSLPSGGYHSGPDGMNAISPIGIITPIQLLQRLFIRRPTTMHQEADAWNQDISTHPFPPSTLFPVPDKHLSKAPSISGLHHRSPHGYSSHASNEPLPSSLSNILPSDKPDKRDESTRAYEHINAPIDQDQHPRAVSTGVLSVASSCYDSVGSGTQSTTARREKVSRGSVPWGVNGTVGNAMRRYERWTDFGKGEREREILRRAGARGSDGSVERIRRRLEGWTDLGDDEEVRKIVGKAC
ncbi:MAG: hypothetical protein Q9187_000190 [Circinaria calcarea]